MVAVGSRRKQFKVKNRVGGNVGAFQTAAGGLKTEDFSGAPGKGVGAVR